MFHIDIYIFKCIIIYSYIYFHPYIHIRIFCDWYFFLSRSSFLVWCLWLSQLSPILRLFVSFCNCSSISVNRLLLFCFLFAIMSSCFLCHCALQRSRNHNLVAFSLSFLSNSGSAFLSYLISCLLIFVYVYPGINFPLRKRDHWLRPCC